MHSRSIDFLVCETLLALDFLRLENDEGKLLLRGWHNPDFTELLARALDDGGITDSQEPVVLSINRQGLVINGSKPGID